MALPPDTALSQAKTEVERIADQYMHRENTDFIGRMFQAWSDAEELCQDGLVPEADAEEYRERMLELAGMALAQAALARMSRS